jgi:hypothetical protein
MANIQVKKPADLAKAGLAKLAAFFALTFFMLTITFPSQAAFCYPSFIQSRVSI